MPVKSVGVPRLKAKGFNTGSLDIVELRIANAPMMQRTKKYRSLTIFLSCNDNQPLTFLGKSYFAFLYSTFCESSFPNSIIIDFVFSLCQFMFSKTSFSLSLSYG